jgi:uncharacterized membrane protein
MESEKDRKIRERAYELWVQSGRSEGTSEQHWYQAEQEYAAGSESPDTSAAAGSAGAAPTSAKKAPRARAASSSASSAAKPVATGASARTPTKRQPAKSNAGKPASTQR